MIRHPLLRRLAVFLALAIAVLPFSAPAAAQDEPFPDWKIERGRWEGTVGAERVLVIHNPHGDVRCRLSSDDSVLATTVIQHHQDDPREAGLSAEEVDGRLELTVAFATAAEAGIDESALDAEMAKRRVDLTVLVPAGVELEIHTRKGLLEAKGLEADVVATTESGRVVIKTRGTVQARSDRGAMDVTLATTDLETPPRLETTTGDISLWLPADAGVTVHAETAGVLSTDYSVDVEHGEGGHKTVSAKIGDGRHRLEIRSVKGDVRLFRAP